jgi:hypothetical protein
MIRITKIRVNGEQTVETIARVKGESPLDTVSWDDAQEFLGGWVEIIPSKKAFLMVDDEGLVKGLPLNITASMISGQRIVGNAIMVQF